MPSPRTPKIQKSLGLWVRCDNCSTNLPHKDVNLHSGDCPPDINTHLYDYIKNSELFGTLDVKDNEDIKAVTQHERDHMVFLSQSVIQICGFSIGEHVQVKCTDLKTPIARMVWPTTEKSVTSVLLTKNAMDLLSLKTNIAATVSHITLLCDANCITLILLNSQKSFVLCTELQTRIAKSYAHKVIAKNNVMSIVFYGRLLKFLVKEVDYNPVQNIEADLGEMSLDNSSENYTFHNITEKTKFKLYKSGTDYQREVVLRDAIEDIGGLDDEISELNELITVGLGLSEVTINFRPSRACLLYGVPGTGKTLVTKGITKTIKAHVVTISSTDLYTKFSSCIDDMLNMSFLEAEENVPSIVIFDEFDVLCPSRASRMTDTEKKVVSKVLTFFDTVVEMEKQIFILGATNKIDTIDPSFRRSGRFDREIEIPTPNPVGRLDILRKMLKVVKLNFDDDALKEIAYNAHGFVGADLQALCSRATLHATHCNRNALELEDFQFALTKVWPSAMREVQIEIPNVHWSDIGGQDNLKLVLKQAVEWPLKHADCFVRMGITPPRGVLMFGPPGCSKTMIAKALATESGLNFISIKGPELFSKWVGESEKAVREVFRKARQVAPSIIFFDEIDALGGERSANSSTSVQERVLAQLLTELDGVTPLGDVTVIAATNRPDRIDKALLRPGRLDRLVLVPLPNEVTRREIFKLKLAKMPVSRVYIADLVEKTQHYTCAEIVAVCNEAAMAALEEDLNAQHVTTKHFFKALEMVLPRTPESLMQIYDEYYLRYRKY